MSKPKTKLNIIAMIKNCHCSNTCWNWPHNNCNSTNYMKIVCKLNNNELRIVSDCVKVSAMNSWHQLHVFSYSHFKLPKNGRYAKLCESVPKNVWVCESITDEFPSCSTYFYMPNMFKLTTNGNKNKLCINCMKGHGGMHESL